MRKVAQAASVGFVKQNSFNEWWPLPEIEQSDVPSFAATSVEDRVKFFKGLGIK